jgi:hypothetical protein
MLFASQTVSVLTAVPHPQKVAPYPINGQMCACFLKNLLRNCPVCYGQNAFLYEFAGTRVYRLIPDHKARWQCYAWRHSCFSAGTNRADWLREKDCAFDDLIRSHSTVSTSICNPIKESHIVIMNTVRYDMVPALSQQLWWGDKSR